MKTVSVGLIGFGMGGRVFHGPLIHHVKGLTLKKIRETKENNIKLIRERYPNAEIVHTSDEIIEDPEIELVVVTTPNKFHYEIAKMALQAGKHVVVDKPFTVNSMEADELIALAEKNRKVLSVFQNRRWDSDFLTVKKVLDEGKLGRIVEYEAHYDRFRNSIRPDTWKEEGSTGTGLLYDLGSHLIDQALVQFGLPKAVTAFMLIQRENSRIVDNFEIILHYDTIKVTLKSGMLVKANVPKYILLGEEGAFVKYGIDPQEASLIEAKKPLRDNDWGQEPEEQWGKLYLDNAGEKSVEIIKSEKGNYPAFYENIYGVITGQEKLFVSAEQGRNTVRIIELATKSNMEQRTVLYSK